MKKLSLSLAVLFSSTFAHAWINVSPSIISFGTVNVGMNSYVSTSFVTNLGNEPEYVNVYGYCPEFVVQSYCYGPLQAHSTCAIAAQMQPQTEGSKFCTVNVSGQTGFQILSLSGMAVGR